MAREPHRLTPQPEMTEQRPKPPPSASPPPTPEQLPTKQSGTKDTPTQQLAYNVTIECPTWKAQVACDHIPVPNELIVVTKPTNPPGQGNQRDAVLTVIRVCHTTELDAAWKTGTITGIVIKCNPYMGFV